MATNPFIYGKIARGESFTDREPEQKRITRNIQSHISTILISPRRWGKSSLHLAEEILALPETVSKSKKLQIVVCIDEFQNFSFFDDLLGFQKKLRASWQQM